MNTLNELFQKCHQTADNAEIIKAIKDVIEFSPENMNTIGKVQCSLSILKSGQLYQIYKSGEGPDKCTYGRFLFMEEDPENKWFRRLTFIDPFAANNQRFSFSVDSDNRSYGFRFMSEE